MDDRKYRLFAIDQGWLDSEDRDVTILVQIARKNLSVTDALSGERIKVNNGTLQIIVPAGAFRILEVVVH
jgi:F0F1-type ATP synthase epsilon subunit